MENNKGAISSVLILIIAMIIFAGAGTYYYFKQIQYPSELEITPELMEQITQNETSTNDSTANTEKIIASVNVKKGSVEVVSGKVNTQDGVIDVTDNYGKTTSLTVADSGEITVQTLTSPTKKHLFYTWGIGDGGNGFIYDINIGMTHALGVISGIKEFKWLEDGRFDYYVGCVTNECYHYVSTSSDSPWVTSLVQ